MNCLRAIVLLAILSISVQAQDAADPADDEKFHGRYSRQHLEKGVVRFGKVRNAGLIVIGTGVAFIATGGILAATSEEPVKTNEFGERQPGIDPQMVVGFLGMVGGTAIAATGTVLCIIGTQKRNQYQGMLESISLKYELNRNRRAIALAYRF
jgi:hypothetical protein